MEDYRRREKQDNRETNLRRLWNHSSVVSNSRSRSINITKEVKEVRKRLIVDEQVLALYSALLKSPDAGVFKLVPRKDCAKAEKRKQCDRENKGVAFLYADSYSFHSRRYADLMSATFSLFESGLSAESNEVQTIIVNLGDVALENLTQDSDGMKFLRDFEPETKVAEIRKQFNKILDGVVDGKYRYAKSSPLKLNDTYAVRAIAYEGNKMVRSKQGSDLIAVMKLVRFEENGTATFVWKQLASKSAPQLVYEN
ncbi:MAG TPA: hypothetical protein VIL74_02690 [Pyrinomonadaceae bacterium]